MRVRNKQEEYIPLDPQPNPDDVLKVHRLYQNLNEPKDGASKFKRRITWLAKSDRILPEIPNTVAIVEYVGTYPGKGYHGGVKDKENNAP